jgi:hypothetical protein
MRRWWALSLQGKRVVVFLGVLTGIRVDALLASSSAGGVGFRRPLPDIRLSQRGSTASLFGGGLGAHVTLPGRIPTPKRHDTSRS